MSGSMQKASLLFKSARQVMVKPRSFKSTMIYEVDKTASQKFLEKQIAKNKKLQDFWANTADGMPLWWKTPQDKFMTTAIFAATISTFVMSCVNCYKFANGTL